MVFSWLTQRFTFCFFCQRRCAQEVCTSCQARLPPQGRTPGGVAVLSLAPYEEPVRSWLHQLKYEEQTHRAQRLGRALTSLLPASWTEAELIPLPLHPLRLAERGYNQSALLARALAERSGQRVRYSLLKRHHYQIAQAQLGRDKRLANLHGAFFVPPALHCATLGQAQAPLLVVDDVFTTGASLDAASSALVQAGYSVLGALTVAFTP